MRYFLFPFSTILCYTGDEKPRNEVLSMKKWLSLLCALALLLALVSATALPAAAETRKTLYHQILERDGFIEGVWYPWFTHDNLGCGLTTNEVAAQYITNPWYDFNKVGIDSYGADKVYAEIYNLKALGFNMLAYAGSAYGEGVVYDDNGDVTGIKQEYLDNVRRFLDICREVGMPVMWNIYFHCSSVPDYYGMDAWNRMCRMLGDNTVADHYAQRFVKPLCKVLGEYDDVVALIALTDEVENEINDPDIPNHASSKAFGATKEDIHYFVNAMNDVVKKEVPQIARTIAANSDDLGMYSDIEVDVLGRNRYSDEGTVPGIDRMYSTAPTLLTEYNLHSASGMSESDYSKIQIKFRDEMKRVGHQGGFLWCWQPNAKGGAMDLLMSGGSTTDFRQSMYDRYYYTIDAIAAHRGKSNTLDTPSLFYYSGNGLLEWVPTRNAASVSIEKSADGNKWQTVETGLNPDSLMKNGKCVYQAKNVLATDYCRVTVTDKDGNVVSAVTNKPGVAAAYMRDKKTVSVTRFKRPSVVKSTASFASSSALTLTSFGTDMNRPIADSYNLIHNGSFEQDGGGQWNYSAFLGTAVSVVKDATAPDGDYSLHFDTRGTDTPKWYTFAVAAEPNTDYTLSVWVKGDYIADDNRFYASFGVLNPATKTFAVYSSYSGRRSRQDGQLYPTAWDNEWHLRTVTFNSGNHSEVVLGLYGCSSEMWLDDIALYAQRYGAQYMSPTAGGVVTFTYDYDYMRCEPSKSLTQNVRMDDGKSTYWQQGGGWDNGFLSIANAPNGYGKALKYTASDNPVGVSYIKWIPVQKHTAYVVTFDYKVVTQGDARIRLGVEQGQSITSVVMLELYGTSFYEDENGWCTFSAKVHTDDFDKLAFIVTDLGGEAYIDNIRVFLPEDGSDVSDVDGGGGTTASVVRPTTTTGTVTTTHPNEEPTSAPPTSSTTAPSANEGGVTDTITTTSTTAPEQETAVPKPAVSAHPWAVPVAVGGGVLLVGAAVAVLLLLRKKKK